ncbi:MAG: hypothetical protein QM571_01385 [Micrococcaceae bacterium]
MEKYTQLIARHKKQLLLIMGALLVSIVLNSLSSKIKSCPEVSTVIPSPSKTGTALHKDYEAVPLTGINPNLANTTKSGNVINLNFPTAKKSFTNLTVLASTENLIIVEAHKGQAKEITALQHEKLTLSFINFNPSAADAAADTTDQNKH